MKASLVSVLLLYTAFLFGQISNNEQIINLKKEAARIEREIQIKTDTLNSFKAEIKHLENQVYLSKFSKKDEGLTITATLKMTGKLRKSNSPVSQTVTELSLSDTIILTDYVNGYWIVNHERYFGYLSEIYVKETDQVIAFKSELNLQNEKLRKKQTGIEIKKQHEYQQKIIKKYGAKNGKKLLDGYYWIGMTDDMARVSLGNPRSINRTVGSWGVYEQWVYYSTYLYFENGKLSSYQNSR
jgi:hypothetical protein